MQKRNLIMRLRGSKTINLVVLFAVIQSLFFTFPVRAGIPCEILLRNVGDKVKTVLQTVRIARLPGIGGYTIGWERARADQIYDSIPDTPEGRQKFMDDFKIRGLEGKTTFEESMVYLRLLQPEVGREWWELLTDSNLIVAKKTSNVGMQGLLKKISTSVSKKEKLELTNEEEFYLNRVVYKGESLFLNKVKYPKRITNVDAHLVSMAKMVIMIKTKQGDPVKAIMKFIATFQDVQFQKDIAGTLLDIRYGLTEDKINAPELAAFKSGVAAFVGEIELKPFEDKKYFLQFFDLVSHPERFVRYNPHLTPHDMKAYGDYGPMGLMTALRKERGVLAATNQFRRVVVASMAFRTLLIMGSLAFAARAYFTSHPNGAGLGAQINSVVDPYATPAPSKDDNLDTAEQVLDAGDFNALAYPGLFDDVKDPAHPERNPSPCDPNHVIRNQIEDLRKSRKYKDDVELSVANPNLNIQAIDQVQTLSEDAGTGCQERFIRVTLEGN